MADVGHMNFFNIDRCGLYLTGSDKVHGCDVSETFDLISTWVKDRSFASPIPWDPHESKENKPKAYCKDIHIDDETGDIFIVLWKSDPGGVEGLLGVPEDDKGSSAKVYKHSGKHKGKKMIWGRPCYYWVIPKYNTIVSIKFDHSVCDAQLFQDYVTSCICNRARHPGRKVEHTDHGFARISYQGDESVRYRYSFSISLKIMDTSNIEIQELSKRVTHIIKREVVKVDAKDARAEWVRKFDDWVPYVQNRKKSRSRKIEIKAEASPSASEIREIISKCTQEGRLDRWNNVGFETDKGVVWADKYRLKDSVLFTNRSGEVIAAEQLYFKISDNRIRYISKLINAEGEKSQEVSANEVSA